MRIITICLTLLLLTSTLTLTSPKIEITLIQNPNKYLAFDVLIYGVQDVKNLAIEGLPAGITYTDNQIVVTKQAKPGSFMLKFIITDINDKKYGKILFLVISSQQLKKLGPSTDPLNVVITKQNTQQNTSNQEILGSQLRLKDVLSAYSQKQMIKQNNDTVITNKMIVFSNNLPVVQTENEDKKSEVTSSISSKLSSQNDTFSIYKSADKLIFSQEQKNDKNNSFQLLQENQNKVNMVTVLDAYNQFLNKQNQIIDDRNYLQNTSLIFEKAIAETQFKMNSLNQEIKDNNEAINIHQASKINVKAQIIMLLNSRKKIVIQFQDRELKVNQAEDQLLSQVKKCQSIIKSTQNSKLVSKIKSKITETQENKQELKQYIDEKQRAIQQLENELRRLKNQKQKAQKQLSNQIKMEEQYENIISIIQQSSSDSGQYACQQALISLNKTLQQRKRELNLTSEQLLRIAKSLKEASNQYSQNEQSIQNLLKQNEVESSQLDQLRAIYLFQDEQKSTIQQRIQENLNESNRIQIQVGLAKKRFEDQFIIYQNQKKSIKTDK